MNDAGRSVGPARGSLGVPLDRIVVAHDEIDFPFGRVEARLGGGTGGHNGLKSLRDGLGSPDFRRVRVGVGRPETTDPEVVSKWVLSRFRESDAEVAELLDDAARAVERELAAEGPQ
jgi:PTH1 family peptidyl-tRNA hydrolase